jgi:hypothetical protein
VDSNSLPAGFFFDDGNGASASSPLTTGSQMPTAPETMPVMTEDEGADSSQLPENAMAGAASITEYNFGSPPPGHHFDHAQSIATREFLHAEGVPAVWVITLSKK